MASVVTVLAFAAGLAAITFGAAWIYRPAGAIIGGVFLVAVSVGYTRGA